MALGAILFSGACKKNRGLGRSISSTLASLASFYGALKAVETLFGIDLTFQRVLIPRHRATRRHRSWTDVAGHGHSLLLERDRAPWPAFSAGPADCRADVASGLGVVVLVVGSVAVTGYLFGTPLLYGGATVPLAATTSGAFFFLGLGLAATAGRDTRSCARALGTVGERPAPAGHPAHHRPGHPPRGASRHETGRRLQRQRGAPGRRPDALLHRRDGRRRRPDRPERLPARRASRGRAEGGRGTTPDQGGRAGLLDERHRTRLHGRSPDLCQ